MSCIEKIHNTSPYPSGSKGGLAVSIAKRVMIGLIAIGILSVGGYFFHMAVGAVFNPFGYSAEVLMGLSIAGSTISGLVVIGLVAVSIILAKQNHIVD